MQSIILNIIGIHIWNTLLRGFGVCDLLKRESRLHSMPSWVIDAIMMTGSAILINMDDNHSS